MVSGSDHFALTELLLYSRGDLRGERAESIAQHLRANCQSCADALGFMDHLQDVTQRDRRARPSPELVARARSLFRRLREEAPPALADLPGAAVRLVFDTFLRPAPAGVRGSLRVDRHLVFRQDDLFLDVHIEPELETDSQSISGQLQSTSLRDATLTGLQVLLLKDEQTVMSTRTNRDGEFAFSGAPQSETSLCIICHDRQVNVLLPPASGMA